MAKEIKNTIRLGLFVVFGIAAFMASVYFIGNQENMFKQKFRISTYFNNVNGLRAGNSVRYAGINVGSVKDIVIVNDSTLRVDMILDENVKNVIKKDAQATIGTDGLVGSMIVNISPGDGHFPPVEDGEVIASFSRIDPNDILMTLGNTNENIAILSLNLLEITEKINTGQGTLPLLIRDSLMARDLRRSLDNLRLTTEYLTMMSRQMQQSIDAVSRGEGMLGYLLNDTTLACQVETFAYRLDTLVLNQTEPILTDLKHSSEDIAAASAALKAVLTELESGRGLASTVLKDTAAANDLRKILENLNEGTGRFNEDMEALKHNFLFRRYFKKQEKKAEKERKAAEKLGMVLE